MKSVLSSETLISATKAYDEDFEQGVAVSYGFIHYVFIWRRGPFEILVIFATTIRARNR
jgi:hypothetical protein